MWVPQDMFFLSISFPRIKRNEKKKLDKTKNPNLMERYKKRKIKNKTLSHECFKPNIYKDTYILMSWMGG